jgi:DNA-binding SARP family transcriptional activator
VRVRELEIDFFRGEVRISGRSLRLPSKEMELLFTVAAAETINGESLMDALWPDADGDAAHNAFRVCLHRLRRHLGSYPVIKRIGRAYRLDDGVRVDLHQLREGVDKCRSGETSSAAYLDELLERVRHGRASREALGTWFEPFERSLRRYVNRCAECLAETALREGCVDEAVSRAKDLLEEDEENPFAHIVIARALSALSA